MASKYRVLKIYKQKVLGFVLLICKEKGLELIQWMLN
jgi:hypothetical protein